jgi:predicted nucleotidyltransferase
VCTTKRSFPVRWAKVVGPDIDHASLGFDTSKAGTFSRHGGHRQLCRRGVLYYALTERPMIADIASHRDELAELCRRFHVRRLDVFGSAARGDFDPARSDLDFLVEFSVENDDLACFVGFKEALEALLARRVDLVDRKAIEGSPNYIRKQHILTGAEAVYAA